MQPLKKIIIVGTAFPYRGGLAAFNERLALEYIKQGYNVEIITFTLQYPNFLFPGKSQFSESNAPQNLLITRKINSINPFNWPKVAKYIRNKQPDMVIFAYWMSFMVPCFGTIAKLVKKKTKCIALVHNMLPHEPSIIDKLLPWYFVKQIDAFVTLSKSVSNDISKFDKNNKPKITNPHPIYDHYGIVLPKEKAKRELNLNVGSHYVLFFGLIRRYKGLDLLLEAFADKRLRELNVNLIVAGEFYEDSKPYYEQIEKLCIADKVVMNTYFIPDCEVNKYFSAVDIIAQPYKTATQSGVTQIAFHFNKPMLVTNVGGLGEIVVDGKIGYVVDPKSDSIADALVNFFENKKEDVYTDNVKQEKGKYSWLKMTEAINKLYDSLF